MAGVPPGEPAAADASAAGGGGGRFTSITAPTAPTRLALEETRRERPLEGGRRGGPHPAALPD